MMECGSCNPKFTPCKDSPIKCDCACHDKFYYKDKNDVLEVCMLCGNTLKPDLEAIIFTREQKIWDGHTYFLCECAGRVNKKMRLVIG